MSNSSFTLYKDTSGEYRWISLYSNNFRDDDHPSEIISEESHRTFVEMVDKGIVPYPQLWLWHVPYVWGQADFVDYVNGFAIASGTVFPGQEEIAESLINEKSLATSHGMPKSLILRDPVDKSVIKFHITQEISPLPQYAAANKRTGFVVLQGDEEMPFTSEKRAFLEGRKLSPAKIKSLEEYVDNLAKVAKEAGVEFKELDFVPVEAVADPVEPVVPAPVTPEPVAVPVTAESVAKEAAPALNYVTAEEVAAVVTEVLAPIMESHAALAQQMLTLTKELSAIKRSDEEKLSHLKEVTPTLSLRELISKGLVGNPALKVDPNSPLGKDAPTENKETSIANQPTMIPFVNGLVQAAQGR